MSKRKAKDGSPLARSVFPKSSPLVHLGHRAALLCVRNNIASQQALDDWLKSHTTPTKAAEAIKAHELTGDASVAELFNASTLGWKLPEKGGGQKAPFSNRVADLEDRLERMEERLHNLELAHDNTLVRLLEMVNRVDEASPTPTIDGSLVSDKG